MGRAPVGDPRLTSKIEDPRSLILTMKISAFLLGIGMLILASIQAYHYHHGHPDTHTKYYRAARVCCASGHNCCAMSLITKTPLFCIEYHEKDLMRREDADCLQEKLYGEIPKPNYDNYDCCNVFTRDTFTIKIRCRDLTKTVGLNSEEKFQTLESAWKLYSKFRDIITVEKAFKRFRLCVEKDMDAVHEYDEEQGIPDYS
uniref:Uncharacterized protein n=1 Tax=Acrobeloides nanus TaxID=290746 RepID=A0A914EFS9_9BILA